MERKNFVSRCFLKKNSYSLMGVLFLALIHTASLSAQIQWGKETLTRGRCWTTIRNSYQAGSGVDSYSPYFITSYPGYSKGTDLNNTLSYVTGFGYTIYGVREGTAGAYSITNRAYPDAQFVYPTKPAKLIKNYNLAGPSIVAEEIVTGAHHVKDLDVDVSHKVMVWSYPKYESFFITELTVHNTGSTPISDVIFGPQRAMMITEKGGSWGDEKYGWSETQNCFYFYDGWSFLWETEEPITWNFGVGPARGDIGDAADIYEQGSREHEIRSPGYYACVLLDSAGGSVYQNITRFAWSLGMMADVEEDRFFLQGAHEPSFLRKTQTHQQPRMSWDEARAAGGEGGNKWERDTPALNISCGPFEIAPGDSVTIVFADVVGEMDRHKIVEGGVANIDLLATESLGALLENIAACRELYTNVYQIEAHPPATPTDGENSLELTPIGGGIKIVWPAVHENYVDPVTGINDFAGYRLYRATYYTIGPWNLVEDIPIAQAQLEGANVVYEDKGLPLGVGNYYTVTSYDTDGNESGKVNNNRYPVYPLRAPNENFPKNVYVVPNPFRQHSRLLGFGENNRIEFIGLPSKCTIQIYTMAGILIKKIKHDDGSGSQAWGSSEKLDYMLNKWMLSVAPGIYIYSVKSEVPTHEGEIFIGKFAIIK